MTRTELYEQLTEIFRDVFDDEELTIEDSTSAEEIEEWNSLNHITLIMEVQEKFGVKFSPGKIFNLHNVGQLVELIIQSSNGTAFSSKSKEFPANFIQFQSGSNDKKPLFLLHPGGGTTISYRTLVSLVRTEQPIYGINLPEGDDGYQKFNNVEEIASQYIQGIRTIQPKSPYYLVGYSSGGIFAFEIAQQLIKQGEEIGLLAMFDTAVPTKMPKFESDLDVMCQIGIMDNDFSVEILRSLEPDEQYKYFLENLTLAKDIFPKTNDWKSLVPFLKATLYLTKISAEYQLKPYAGKITYFRGKEYTASFADDIHKQWLDVAPEMVVECVPGNHLTIMNPPNVQVLAQKLQPYLDEALEADAAASEESKSSPVLVTN